MTPSPRRLIRFGTAVVSLTMGSLMFLGQPSLVSASGGVQLDPGFTIRMDLPLDCESASLAAALTIRGINVNTGGIPLQNWVFNSLPKDGRASFVKNGVRYWGDAYQAFVGSVYGSEANYTGYGVYYAPIAAIAQAAGATVGFAGTGFTTQQIESQILDGNPVVIWIDTRSLGSGGTGYGTSSYTAFDGRPIPYSAYDHAIVVVGADPGHNLTILEDHSGIRYTYTEAQFTRMISSFHGMAVAVGPALRVSSVSPSTGPTSGGETVTVHGIGFGQGLTASVGTSKVTPFAETATSFSFTAPPHPSGIAAVQVSRTGVSSPLSAADAYTYYGPAVIASLSPAAGPASGGQEVTVTGYGFTQAMTATLGGVAVSPSNQTSDSFSFTAPSKPAGYDQLVVTTSLGVSTPTAAAGYIYTGLGNYVPLTPFRILDTRVASAPIGPGLIRTLRISGVGPSPVPASATAVVLNVTAVGDTVSSFLSLYPTGTAQPGTSSLNFGPKSALPNLITVTLGQNGLTDANREVSIFNAEGEVNVVVDVEGYFAPADAASPLGEFHAMAPIRVCDTRLRQPSNACNTGRIASTGLGAGQVMKVNVTGNGAIPGDGGAEAGIFNLTAIAPSASTYLAVYPTLPSGDCPRTSPTSNVNLAAGGVHANRVMVPLGPASPNGPSTDLCVFNAAGSVNFALDASGWFGSGTAVLGAQFQPIGPVRICDTRTGSRQPCAGSRVGAAATLTVTAGGVKGIPADGVTALVGNLTGVDASTSTFLAVYAADLAGKPRSSDVNLGPGTALSNLVVVALSRNGQFELANATGSTDAVIDVDGWFH